MGGGAFFQLFFLNPKLTKSQSYMFVFLGGRGVGEGAGFPISVPESKLIKTKQMKMQPGVYVL